MKTNFACALLALCMLATACKKSKTTPAPEPVTPPVGTPTSTRQQLTADSIFLYAKEIYLWNDKLPSYESFNPRKYTNFDQELFDITKYSSYENNIYEPGTPKYSYISDKADDNPIMQIDPKSSVDLEGNGYDVGLRLVPYITNATTKSYLLFVTGVYQNSPGEKAGIKRGVVISKINGQAFGANYDNEKSALFTAINGNTLNIEGKNYLTDVAITANLTKSIYKSSRIYSKKIFTAGEKKIGYLALARFSTLSVNGSNPSDVDLDTSFTSFANNAVTDLIIDLRYNGGGYVSTASYLMNLIAPSSLNNKVMYTEYFNSTMQNKKAVILKNQPLLDDNGKIQTTSGGRVINYFDDIDYSSSNPLNIEKFSKKGSLQGVQNVVFLVTDNTASASELVINSLKPYMNVKVIGLTTYGKPVGFFPITIENKYDVYYAMFESKNSLGQGGYFNGIAPDAGYDEEKDQSGVVWDDPRYDFGNKEEGYIKAALKFLAPSSPIVVTSNRKTTMSINGRDVNVSKIKALNSLNKEFIGMVDKPKNK